MRRTVKLSRVIGRVPILSDVLFWYYCYVRADMQPPQLFNYVGFPDFAAIGRGYFDEIVRLGGVQPDHSVLDVGCGIGRVAIQFTTFLRANARYAGFDVVPKGPTWCNQKIAKRFPNFSFDHVDVYNRHYNRRGTVAPNEFRFPYDDGSFDFAFATSVFTHMLPGAVAHYLSELSRVLKCGGRCFISYFLLNDQSEKYMVDSDFNFTVAGDGYKVKSEKDPEAAIAYEEGFVTRLYRDAGLRPILPIHYGDWSGRVGAVGGQDIILAEKPAVTAS